MATVLGLCAVMGACAAPPPSGDGGRNEQGDFATVASGITPEAEIEGQPGAVGPAELRQIFVEVDAAHFGVEDAYGGYAFSSGDGRTECMFSAVHLPDLAPGGFLGGCQRGEDHQGGATTVVMVAGRGESGVFAQEDDAYPGEWYGGGPTLRPGQFVEIGGQVACFSTSVDTVGCLEYSTGEGYRLIGREFAPFGADRAAEILGADTGGMPLHSMAGAVQASGAEGHPVDL